jgi:recombination protein RecA
MSKAREAALRRFKEKFEKNYGEGSLELAADNLVPYEVISTGSLTLDYRTGVGGLVEGRLVEYWGPDGVGKTTFAMMACREAQKKHDKEVAWIDVEHKLDKPWAAAQGVDLKRCHIYPPNNAEDVADAMKDMIRSDLFSIIVLDSIGGMIPEAEKEKDADQAVMAQQAKIVTRMVKIAATEAPKTHTIPLFINQVRANLSYGADTTTGGGFALKHATTMKMRFRRTGDDPLKASIFGEDKPIIVGHKVAIYIERNGVAPAYKTAIVGLFNQPTEKYGPQGVDIVDEAVTLGLNLGVIDQSGGWYTLPTTGERINGRDKLVEALRHEPDTIADLRTRILATVAGEVHEEELPPEAIPVVEDDPGEPKPTKATKKRAPAKKATAKKKPAFRKGAAAAMPEQS